MWYGFGMSPRRLLLAGVVRVSHMGTRKRDADSFHADEEQTAEIHAYARELGADVVMLPPELDMSGGLPIEQRPSLTAAIVGVERGDYDGVIFAYLKRATRSRSGHQIWDRVERKGGKVYTARERLDTSTASGRFIRDIWIADAVREREDHGEQHAARRKRTVEAGMWRQRQTPRGYRFAGPADAQGRFRGKARKLVPDASAREVRWAFKARSQGASLASLADKLGMTPSGARKLLSNRVYLGEIREGGIVQRDGTTSPEHVNPDAHDALVEPEEFAAAQVETARPARTPDLPPALLAGLVRCSGCGHVMSRRNAGKQPSYYCKPHKSNGRCPAPASISMNRLDAYVDGIARAAFEQLRVEGVAHGSGIDDIRVALAGAEIELETYMDAVSAADVGADVFQRGARKRRGEVDELRTKLTAALGREPLLMRVNGAAGWDRLHVDERNHALRGLVRCVVVAKVGAGQRVPVHERVRVLHSGAEIVLPGGRGGVAAELVALPLPDADDEAVLGEAMLKRAA